MSTLQELEAEKCALEEKVHKLVDKLETKKKPDDMKVPKEFVIRSKEEQEASSAMQQLAISEESKPNTVTGQPDKSGTDKSQEQKGKQKGRAKEPPAPEKPVDISRLDLRIGKIVEVSRHEQADALYVEKILCGDPTGPRTVISGLVNHVAIEEMQDRSVVVLCNLKPAKMRGIVSEAMVMCASTPDKVEPLKTPPSSKPGDRIYVDGYPGSPDEQLNPKKKIWEQVSVDLKTSDDGVATYKGHELRVVGIEGHVNSELKNAPIR